MKAVVIIAVILALVGVAIYPKLAQHHGDALRRLDSTGELHWRLVFERQDSHGDAVSRQPVEPTYYATPFLCIAAGHALEFPELSAADRHAHIVYLIRCLPYGDTEDTPNQTPLYKG